MELKKSTKSIHDAIKYYAENTPAKCALQGPYSSMNYAELALALEETAHKLSQVSPNVLGLAMDNDPAWAVIDLAAASLGLPVVPLPQFFSSEQIIHAIVDAGIDVVLSDQPLLFGQMLTSHGSEVMTAGQYQVGDKILTEFILRRRKAAELPAGTAKVTYTSGTTDKPKGVCLKTETLLQVAVSLAEATEACATDRHLSMLPLSTLLENVAGIYVPLLAGATTILLPAAKVGLIGASNLSAEKMMAALTSSKASTTVLTPVLLGALVTAIEAGHPKPKHLRFVAVGGASVAPRLLKRAAAVGLPVFEGYGLSECTSVVALNTPHSYKLGSVGKPLRHLDIRFAADGEILVSGSNMLGYAGRPNSEPIFWPTGDIGFLDDEGFLHINGRKKNMFITSFGRNVAPEWVERELMLSPAIAQAAVFGEARPWNIAVIFPARNALSEDIDMAIAEVNQMLPDYARVSAWFFADAPFTPQNLQLTANGRLRREVIWKKYQSIINALYEEDADVVL